MATYLYERKLLNEPEVRSQITGARLLPSSMTLEFDNSDGYYTDLYTGGEEFRGDTVKLEHYESEYETKYKTFIYAVIDEVELGHRAKFTCTVLDHEPLKITLPKKSLDADSPSNWNSYPSVADATQWIPAKDQGKPIALIFGNASKVPCRYALYDAVNNYWDYIVGPNALVSSVATVYRNKVVVDSSEYTLNTDSTYTDEDGISYAFLRFTSEQLDFNGDSYEIEADINSPSDFRDFAYTVQKILTEAWGCGVSVNSSTFTAAQDSNYKLDGAVYEQINAQDLIDDILECRPRAYIHYTSDGWAIVVDESYNSSSTTIDNIKDYTYTPCPSKQNVIKDLKVRYRYNRWENEYQSKLERSCNSFGQEQVLELPYVRDHETADRIASRMQNIQQHAGERLNLLIGTEGRSLDIYDPIAVAISWWHQEVEKTLVDSTFQILNIRKSLDEYELECKSYSSDIYTYSAGTLPSDPGDDSRTDYSHTNPDSPTSLQQVSSSSYQAPDGSTKARMSYSAVPPSKNFTKMVFGRKRSGGSVYYWQDGEENGSVWECEFDELTPGMSFTIEAMAMNSFGLGSLSNPTLTGETAPGDTSAPSTPNGLSATARVGGIRLTWTANTEADLSHYDVYLSGTGIVGTAPKDAGSFVYPTEQYSTTLYFRIRAVDYSGNTSSYTSYVSTSPLQSNLDNDVEDGSTYARVKGIYLSDGQHKLSSIYDDGGTLTISSSKLKISTTDGFEVDTGGGVVISASQGVKITNGSSLYIIEGGNIDFGTFGYINTTKTGYSNIIDVHSDNLYLEGSNSVIIATNNNVQVNATAILGSFQIGQSSNVISHIYATSITLSQGVTASKLGVGTYGPIQSDGIQLAYGTSGYGFVTSENSNHLMSNAYFDGGWKYIGSDKAASVTVFPNGRISLENTNTTGSANGSLSLIERFVIEADGDLKKPCATEDLRIKDAGSTGATEQAWVEATVGGVTGYVRIYASK